jgi:hypothetical protein
MEYSFSREPFGGSSRSALTAALLLTLGCSGSSGPSGPDNVDVGQGITLEGGSTLVFQDGGRLDSQRAKIERVVKGTLAAVRPLLPLDGITIRVEADSRLVIPEIGIGARADANTIHLAFNSNLPAQSAALDSELLPLLAHEMHHVARFHAVGFISNLFEAMINEGLADHFSVEVAGADPPIWASALTAEQLATWSERARAEWFDSSYNHDAWFFGLSPVIPRWAGYSIGFDLVRQFLAANPSRRPSKLHAEPAASFIP